MAELEWWWNYLAHCRSHHQADLHGELRDSVLPDHESRNWRHGKSGKWMEGQGGCCFYHRNASDWLHFQRLDRQRHGLVYWRERSGFNYDERTYRRGGRFYSEY